MLANLGGIKSKRGIFIWRAFCYLILILISVATVVPFLFMFSTSLTESFTMMSYPPTLFPDNPSLANYWEIVFNFQNGLFLRWFFNTIFTTVCITAGSIVLNTLAGYIFAKKEFYGKRMLFILLLSTMMVPGAVTLIPAFLMINKLRLFDTYWAVILPGLASPFGIFMMRQFISSLPTELIEVSKLDGASEFRIFWSIIMPLSLPGMAALGIFTVINSWNSFLWPLVVLRSSTMRTLVVGLSTLKSEYITDYGLIMAGAVLTVVPLIILYTLFQPYFVEGLRMGSGK